MQPEAASTRACEASLVRLGTDHLDLYLLHWRGEANLSEVVTGFESLRAAGRIRAWGVSNFSVRDMEDLFRVQHGDRCTTNQVLYNVGARSVELDLLPWCERHAMPVMAYSPLGGSSLLRDPVLVRIGAARRALADPYSARTTHTGCSVPTAPARRKVSPHVLTRYKVQRFFKVTAWLLVLTIVLLSLGPPSSRPVTGAGNNVEHLLIFLATGAAFGLSYDRRYWLLVVALVAFAAAIE
jgi:hypothetical protein